MRTQDDTIESDDPSDDAMAADISNVLGGGEDGFVYEPEKKQVSPGTLLLIGLAAIAAAGIWMMSQRNGPAAASAASNQAQDADQTITQFLSSGDRNIRQMQEMLRNTEGIVEQFKHYPSIEQVPLSRLQTNPFRFQPKGQSSDGKPARRSGEAERNAALQSVQQLTLQSIMHSGAHRSCMINDQLYQEGQQADEFLVERITPDSVIVKTGIYRFELKMR